MFHYLVLLVASIGATFAGAIAWALFALCTAAAQIMGLVPSVAVLHIVISAVILVAFASQLIFLYRYRRKMVFKTLALYHQFFTTRSIAALLVTVVLKLIASRKSRR
jgi:cephalosporin-C deacetylase-like acetyl esterase